MSEQPALVVIVPRKNLWDVIQKEKWYHMPVESAPKNAALTKYLSFYFPEIFSEATRYRVNFYAKVKKVDIVKRIQLFPEELAHQRANSDYFKFCLGPIKKLPKPIPSFGRRRIIHIATSYKKLLTAEEINDVYDTSPLEEKVYLAMKKRNIRAERQLYVQAGEQYFCLDFGMFCAKGKIDVECDGKTYHTSSAALAKDGQRNNQLNSLGWHVLRFTGKEINRDLQGCFKIIERTIQSLGGIRGN